MRVLLGLGLAACLLLSAAGARGDGTIYRYTNRQGRTVYVNHIDQVPPEARASARPVELSAPASRAAVQEEGPYLALARGQALPLGAAGVLLFVALRLALVPRRAGARRLWPAPLLGGVGVLAYVALGTGEGQRVTAELGRHLGQASAPAPAKAPEQAKPAPGAPIREVYRDAARRQEKALRDQLKEANVAPMG